MGLVYATATIDPSKQELVEAWLPAQSWASGTTSVEKVAEYRFDVPEGEVGVETIVWRTPEGVLLQVPFTYRAAALAGAEEFLVGTSQHSVLGPRWIYDGCGDPVWAAAVTSAILTGGTQAQMVVERDGRRLDVPPRLPVRGSGSPDASVPAISSVESVAEDGPVTVVTAGPLTISLARVVGTPLAGDATLTGSVADQDLGVLVALQH
jgi:hypothetical protein